jgi:outer membrane protein
LIERGYGVDSAVTYFLAEKVALECSLGVAYNKVKKSSLNDLAKVYGQSTPANTKKSNNIWLAPAAIALQYHIAPYGAIRPYIGAGGHATYAYTRSKAFSMNNGLGAIFRAGVDIVAKDDTFITFDVKRSMMKTKITAKKAFLDTDEDLSSRIKLNSTNFSLGFGFNF